MDEREKDIEKFAQYLKRRAPGRRTAVDYVCDVRQFAVICIKPWREVTMHDIDAFVDRQRHQGLSPATIKRRVAGLKVFFDFLAEENDDLSWPNPVRFKRHAGKQPKRLARDLTNEQVERLWAVIDHPRDRAWFALMLRAGLRVGEVVSLKKSDLLRPATAQQPGRLRVCGKGQKERTVLLTADAYAILQTWLQQHPQPETEIIFLNHRNLPLSVSGIEWLLKGYGQAAQVPVTPHQLRHTYARQLTEGGMPLTSLTKLLGHAQLSTTQIYTAGADPTLAEAYQQAMAHLTEQQLTVSSPAANLSSAPSQAGVEPGCTQLAPPPLPNWDAWASDLPESLRHPSLVYAQHCLPNWKPKRQRTYALKLLNRLACFWRWQLNYRALDHVAELRLADLRAFQQAHVKAGQATTTVNRTTNDVLAVWRMLAEQDPTLDPAILRFKPLPRPECLPRHLTESQSCRLENYVQARLDSPEPLCRLENACFFVLAHTGLRLSECVDLQFQDLDLKANRLTVRQGKGRRDRVVYLSPLARQAIDIYLDGMSPPPTMPLWRRPDGLLLSDEWLRNHIKALAQAAGVPKVTPHRLRHTFATRLLNAGMDITRIQKLLGHQLVTTTQIYARVFDTTVEADYHQTMKKIEQQQISPSDTPELVSNWPIYQRDQSFSQVDQPQVENDNFV